MKQSHRLIQASVIVACLSLIALGVASASDKTRKVVTFDKDVAPIFFRKCAECHRAGESAPMSLTSYKEARPWARSIKEKVLTREMPPWHADPRYGEFANDRRLSDAEIKTIVDWVEGGAAEGTPKDPPNEPGHRQEWNIGTPDLVLQMPEEITLKASGTDEYHYVELPAQFSEDKYVQMAELRPSNRKVAHHITAFIIPPPGGNPYASLTKEQIEKLRAEMEKGSIFYSDGNVSRVKPGAPIHDDGCVLPSGGSATSWDGSGQNWSSLAIPLTVYSPGVNPVVFQPATARKIPAGSRIILQAHYWKPEAKVEKDRTVLGLVFAKTPPAREVETQLLINNYFMIPPGAEHHQVTACWVADREIQIISLMPHMHWRGRAMMLEAFYPDGRTEVLLSVPKYNFSWQTTYYLKKPTVIPKDTRLRVTSYFDNSTNNKRNPDPTRAVRAGEPTGDEMMACFVDYTVDSRRAKETALKGSKRK